MPRQAKAVRDMDIDEVSLVDAGAAQHSRIVIAKRASQEDTVPDAPDQIFTLDGQPITLDDLEIGDVVQDAEGNQFEWASDAEADEVDEDERELAGAVAKASPFGRGSVVKNDSLSALREELAKAAGDDSGLAEVVSKALGRMEELEKRASAAEEIAKAERVAREEREYIAKAADYNLPVDPAELGPILRDLWEAEATHGVIRKGACEVLHKALVTAGQVLFEEAGYTGQSDNADPFAQIDAYLDEHAGEIAKSAGREVGELSKAGSMTQFFRDNPEAYDAYVADRQSR